MTNDLFSNWHTTRETPRFDVPLEICLSKVDQNRTLKRPANWYNADLWHTLTTGPNKIHYWRYAPND